MSLRILIVDDSSAMRAYVRATLEDEWKAEVLEATSGFEALRILPRQSFDVVVVDINMPNINGLELISFMRRSGTHKETPLIIISTEASKRDRDKAFTLGANAYLAKPFTAEQLLEVLSQFRKSEG